MPLTPSIDLPLANLIERMLAGDRMELARLISRVENGRSEVPLIMKCLFAHSGHAHTIGITGPPGAGKSTLTDRLITQFRSAEQPVGVVAVDPSSPFSGGAVLGDRIRMQTHFLDPEVFIRSLSTRGSRGGLARSTRDVVRLLDAFGKRYIIVETVGVGQTELDVMEVADTVVVILVPEAGDTIQVMKAGLLEIAHIFVVNKADREGADKMKAELEAMLQLRPESPWRVPVLLTDASRSRGIEEVAGKIADHLKYLSESGTAAHSIAEQQKRELFELIEQELAGRLEKGLAESRKDLLAKLASREVDPYTAALELLGDREELCRLLCLIERKDQP